MYQAQYQTPRSPGQDVIGALQLYNQAAQQRQQRQMNEMKINEAYERQAETQRKKQMEESFMQGYQGALSEGKSRGAAMNAGYQNALPYARRGDVEQWTQLSANQVKDAINMEDMDAFIEAYKFQHGDFDNPEIVERAKQQYLDLMKAKKSKVSVDAQGNLTELTYDPEKKTYAPKQTLSAYGKQVREEKAEDRIGKKRSLEMQEGRYKMAQEEFAAKRARGFRSGDTTPQTRLAKESVARLKVLDRRFNSLKSEVRRFSSMKKGEAFPAGMLGDKDSAFLASIWERSGRDPEKAVELARGTLDTTKRQIAQETIRLKTYSPAEGGDWEDRMNEMGVFETGTDKPAPGTDKPAPDKPKSWKDKWSGKGAGLSEEDTKILAKLPPERRKKVREMTNDLVKTKKLTPKKAFAVAMAKTSAAGPQRETPRTVESVTEESLLREGYNPTQAKNIMARRRMEEEERRKSIKTVEEEEKRKRLGILSNPYGEGF